MLGAVINFLADRRRPCADCSLAERQVVCARDDLGAERLLRHWHAAEHRKESDGLMRELIMERMRMAEMKQQARLQHVSRERCILELRRRLNETKAIAQDERQQRIAAVAELKTCQETLGREMALTGVLRTRVEHAEMQNAECRMQNGNAALGECEDFLPRVINSLRRCDQHAAVEEAQRVLSCVVAARRGAGKTSNIEQSTSNGEPAQEGPPAS